MIPYGLNRVMSIRQDPGGKGINVAKVLKDFEADVTVFGLLAGNQGKLLSDFLKDAEIKSDFLQIQGETRTNLKILDKSNNEMTEINETGFEVTPEDLEAFKEKFKKSVKEAATVVLCGSLPPGISNNFCIQTSAVCRNRKKNTGGKRRI